MESSRMKLKQALLQRTSGQIKAKNNQRYQAELDDTGESASLDGRPLVASFHKGATYSAIMALLIGSIALCLVSGKVNAAIEQLQATSNLKNYRQPQHDGEQQQQRALEAELNSIVQQHDATLGAGNDKLLAEAIISRLMVDNLTGSSLLSGGGAGSGADEQLEGADLMNVGESQPELVLAGTSSNSVETQQQQASSSASYPSGPEALRLRKLLSMLQNYENGPVIGQNYAPFPLLPGQAATMKRAAMRMGAYLQPRTSQSSGYSRDSFNFGLGKRGPDGSVGLGNILRYGDALGGLGMQPVSGLGKRPSAHRFDFGLGKRVASPGYPTRYDFGLGKRAPNRIRYDFGLGK